MFESDKAQNENSLCMAKRLSKSNFELNANSLFKSKFTWLWKNCVKKIFKNVN